MATPALAAPDFDGDGATTGDCAPLDPAVHPAASDRPDLALEDLNCDGVDGSRTGAYFVALNGNNGNPGSLELPFQTIQHAIDKAAAQDPKLPVYVMAGNYAERLVLATGVSVYGGYLPSGSRSKEQVTNVNAPAGQTEAVFASAVTGSELQLLTVNGADAAGAGASTYGIRAVTDSALALVGVTVNAADATNAANAVQPGGTGPGGLAGRCGGYFLFFVVSCNSNATGGSGGGGGGGASAGGKGGDSGTTSSANGQAGAAGGGTGGGSGGVGGPRQVCPFFCFSSDSGAPGGNAGTAGTTGTIGDGGSLDTSAAGATWANGDTAAAGGAGSTGHGGGGGGGAKGWQDSCGNQRFGGAGGGGGGGGGGGAGGPGGPDGGGSFAVYLFKANVVSVQSKLIGGVAGDGGNGATGQAGGPGGDGGAGAAGQAPANNCTGTPPAGGQGGSGSAGGQGGAGGGGAGGPSAGLMAAGSGDNASRFVFKSTEALGGEAGTGGNIGGSTTKNGGDGVSVASLPIGAGNDGAIDFDGDGKPDADDACVTQAATTGDGCPARAAKLGDADGDGIPDKDDKCGSTPAGSNDANGDGCPDISVGQDADGDGFGAAQECNDSDAKINPRAQEVVGNAIDENCDGVATPFPKVAAGVDFGFDARNAKFTKVTKLAATNVPAGATVEVRCRAKKGCQFKTKKVTVKTATSLLNLKKHFNFTKKLKKKNKKKKAKKKKIVSKLTGGTIEIRITAPDTIGKVVTFKIVKLKSPPFEVTCLPVGATTPQKTC